VIGWVDASAGASGDMLLGALAGAGVPVDVLQRAVTAVAPEDVSLRVEAVTRNGFAATRCHIDAAESDHRRTWRDVERLLAYADLETAVRDRAQRAFLRLAEAEATVHGVDSGEVHFHEVGALDAIADVVGVSAGIDHLGLDRLVVSAVAVGSGRAVSAHGPIPVPAPAVVELLRGVPSYAGPPGAPDTELCTPTGAALLTANADGWGTQPLMRVSAVGIGAGSRDPHGHPNVLRLLVGEPSGTPRSEPIDDTGNGTALLIEANVDDLDPRLWPTAIATLLEAGASDAWLTPIVMKKGRPAHTLSVLVGRERADQVRAEIFAQTSTIGLRETPVGKIALDREETVVQVAGRPVRVKLARHRGRLVNAQPEYDDVARVAADSCRPAKDVLAEAVAAARAAGVR
jgi:uncharacterized protein (TIGR00299 family) protein